MSTTANRERQGWIGTLRAMAARCGSATAVVYGLNRGFARLGCGVAIYVYRLVAQPVPPAPLLAPRRGRSIAIRDAAADDPALAGLPLTAAVIGARFAQGAHCFLATQEGQVVGCLWLCLDGYDEDEVRCRFAPEPAAATAWDFDVYVCPDHRGGLAFLRLWDAANGFLRAHGRGWTMSRISAFSPGSRAAHARLGAVPVGWLLALRGGRWQLTLSGCRPRLHFSFGARQVPRYAVPAPARAAAPTGATPPPRRAFLESGSFER